MPSLQRSRSDSRTFEEVDPSLQSTAHSMGGFMVMYTHSSTVNTKNMSFPLLRHILWRFSTSLLSDCHITYSMSDVILVRSDRIHHNKIENVHKIEQSCENDLFVVITPTVLVCVYRSFEPINFMENTEIVNPFSISMTYIVYTRYCILFDINKIK